MVGTLDNSDDILVTFLFFAFWAARLGMAEHIGLNNMLRIRNDTFAIIAPTTQILLTKPKRRHP